MAETPFVSLEAAHEYVGLLLDAVREARDDVVQDFAAAPPDGVGVRRREALQLVAWKLERLDSQLASSRRLIHDLRRLQRLLLGEGDEQHEAEQPESEPPRR
jgi:hypothetical protein